MYKLVRTAMPFVLILGGLVTISVFFFILDVRKIIVNRKIFKLLFQNFVTMSNILAIRIFSILYETLGPWCKETIDFINVIGDRLIAESGDSKSKKFLFERISLAIQRGNAASIRGTFPDSALLSEIFAL
jgi:hypothetical protein